jgi:hypothetical protein
VANGFVSGVGFCVRVLFFFFFFFFLFFFFFVFFFSFFLFVSGTRLAFWLAFLLPCFSLPFVLALLTCLAGRTCFSLFRCSALDLWSVWDLCVFIKHMLFFTRCVQIYRSQKWHYFMIDFCYYNSMLLMELLWKPSPSDSHVLVVFALSMGPLVGAIWMWKNALVFSDLDRFTSVFIHFVPVID